MTLPLLKSMNMFETFSHFHPLLQGLLGSCFTWLITSLGAGVVFFFQRANRKVLDAMLGFAAGIMIAASFWSLLAPAIELSKGGNLPVWIPPSAGFIIGGLFIWTIDKLLPHLHFDLPENKAEGLKSHFRRNTLLILAVTIHNIPEGFAVGVGFGSASIADSPTTLQSALALTLGIGLQDFPEGLAISLPLYSGGMSKLRSFFYGQLSGFIEVLAAIVGVIAVISIQSIMPYTLAFAAGAMIYVVVEELIPESQYAGNTDLATLGTLGGFLFMMMLDVGLS